MASFIYYDPWKKGLSNLTIQGRWSSFNMGGGSDIECHQKSPAFRYIPFGFWSSQGRIFAGQNRVALGRAQGVKQRVALGASCKTAMVLGGGGIDLLLGCVSPLHRESFMPYEVLNEDKTNVGERLLS